MNTFKRKTLYAAVAGVAAIAVAGTAQAVNISADGLGQVLIYPYYTVNANPEGQPYNTLLSIVNTTTSTKAVKVRFREGRESVEVLDFNVFLSPLDVWTASVTPGDVVSGTPASGVPAKISTTDKSCTIPPFPATGVNFRGDLFVAQTGDNALARTREGYFEVFEMATYGDLDPVAINSKHTSAGVPLDCTKVTNTAAQLAPRPPTGGLFGGEVIVNPAGGGAFSQSATALANFTVAANYQTTGSVSPQYSDANPPISNVIHESTLYRSTWTNGTNAVTAVLMANALTNEYVLDPGSHSQTNWIITQPTKYAYVGASGPLAPYTTKYAAGKGACEPVFQVVLNREEGSPQVVSQDDFSPQPGPGPGPVLCWEANIIAFSNTAGGVADNNLFGSSNINYVHTPYINGWSVLAFNAPTGAAVHSFAPASTQTVDLLTGGSASAAVTYYGLPAIGFAAQTFNNDALVVGGKTYLSTFGADFIHHATKRIQ